MNATPNIMKLGMGLAFVGAICSFVAMAMVWDGSVGTAAIVGVDMAVALIFFAVAGCFSTYSPVKTSTITVLSAIAVAAAIIAAIFGGMNVVLAVILAILGALCVFCSTSDSTKSYVETNRVI